MSTRCIYWHSILSMGDLCCGRSVHLGRDVGSPAAIVKNLEHENIQRFQELSALCQRGNLIIQKLHQQHSSAFSQLHTGCMSVPESLFKQFRYEATMHVSIACTFALYCTVDVARVAESTSARTYVGLRFCGTSMQAVSSKNMYSHNSRFIPAQQQHWQPWL